MATSPISDAANDLSKQMNCDVFYYSGEITRARALEVERLLGARQRRPNLLFTLVTQGGDPDAAFRIGRAFQALYPGEISGLIPGWCKSAGTLLTLAASKLYVGDLGELGPLDIQIAKQDEIEEAASGLLVETTLRTLETTATRMFINITRTIRRETGVTTKMASEVSAKMVIGLMSQVYSQIEPMKVGENARAMNITTHYGRRLSMVSRCLVNPDSLEILVRGYPDHGFVIDRREAASIYKNVESPTLNMLNLVAALGKRAFYPPASREQGESAYLSTEANPTSPTTGTATGAKSRAQSAKPAGRSGGSRSARAASTSGAVAKGRTHRANGRLLPSAGER